MIKIVIPILFITFFFIEVLGQIKYPKREFRGAWVATVANIDWPSSKLSTSEDQIKELKETFDKLREAGINAVIAHVTDAAEDHALREMVGAAGISGA